MTAAGRWAAGTAFALLCALAFPLRAGEGLLDLGWACGWFALVPFAWGVRGLRPRSAFGWGTGFGTLAYTGVLFWIYVVVHVHGHAPPWVAVLAVLALSLYVGLHVGLAASLVAWLAPRAGAPGVLVLPAAWVVAEYLRTFDLFTGFPWAFLGYSAHLNPPLLALAGLGGVYGLSFLLASFAALLAERRWRPALLLFAVAHALGFAWGVRSLPGEPPPAERRWVGLVQANIPQDQKWDPERAEAAFAAHLETSRLAALAGHLDLIVWPEAAVPVLLEREPSFRRDLVELARETGSPLVVGGIGFAIPEAPPGAQRLPRYYNSVFFVGADGGVAERYDKSRLVPFGEYVPARALLGFLSGLATGIAVGDITPGPGPRTFRVEGPTGDHAVSPLICYEVIYPSLVREAVLGGARVLLNVTNDAWYGRTSAPHQFLAIAALRSAETGRPMLRAANTGVSAVIDAAGLVRAGTPIFERRALRARIPEAKSGNTLYTRLGDWVVWTSFAILVSIGGWAVGAGRRGGDAGVQGTTRGAGGAGRRTAEAPLTSRPSGSSSPS